MFSFNKPLTPAQRLERNVQIIMAHDSMTALGPIIMLGTKCIDDTPTARTDGLDEMYGADFVGRLTDPEFRFVILHESGHKMYQHLHAWRHLYDENPQKTNIACDIVLNDWLIKVAAQYPEFIQMPAMGVTGATYGIDSTGKDVPDIYALLPDAPQEKPMDSHDWEQAKERTPQEVREMEQQVAAALQQGALLASKTGTGNSRVLSELLEPRVDWRSRLQDYVLSFTRGRGVSTWRKPNRHTLAHGLYLPGQVAERLGVLVVAVDTSGSISSELLRSFLTEIAAIMTLMSPESVHLMYWDTTVCADEQYDETTYASMPYATKPQGGGGTVASCVPRYMQEYGIAPDLAIIFTDGYVSGSWGEWPCPTLWCITSNISSPIGATLRIK